VAPALIDGRSMRGWRAKVAAHGMYTAAGTLKLGREGVMRRSLFGDVVVVAFLIAQASDGVLTYVGVRTYGLHIEGNPLLGWLMAWVGQGVALAVAKTAAGAFGIVLHLTSVHRVVALLTVFYFAAAVVPWIRILFY
jgi:arginine exporter protein ArgO